MSGAPKPTEELVRHYEKTGKAALSVLSVGTDQISNYGVIDPVSNIGDGPIPFTGIFEKPDPDDAPSDFAAVGRYVFQPSIFDNLREVLPGVGGEIQLNDAINAEAQKGKVDAIRLTGRRYDCGSKFGYLEAIVDCALEHPECRERFAEMVVGKLAATQDAEKAAELKNKSMPKLKYHSANSDQRK